MSFELDTEGIQCLILSASDAAVSAYCPYSEYPVGAALLGADGETYIGCNVENSSYGLSICAERVALFNAVSNGCRKFVALALVGGGRLDAATPCGACRQVLSEFCAAEMPIFYAALKGSDVARTTIGDLLPLAFKFNDKKETGRS